MRIFLIISFKRYTPVVKEVFKTCQRRRVGIHKYHKRIRTIKELIKQNPIVGWGGSAQDLMKKVYDVTGVQIAESPSAVGKLIAKYEFRLHCDDIEHTATKSNARSHKFTKIIRGTPYGYQKTIYDRDDD